MGSLNAASTVLIVCLLVAPGLSKPSEEGSAYEEIEMDYQLPPRTADVCRSRIAQLQEEYINKIKQERSRETELRREFYAKVEENLENCNPPPKLVNVSGAPDSMPEECKERLGELNEEIRSSTNKSTGSRVTGKYRDRYENVLKGCVAGAAVEKLEQALEKKLFDGKKRENNLAYRIFDVFMERIKHILVKQPSAAGKLEIGPTGKVSQAETESREREIESRKKTVTHNLPLWKRFSGVFN